MIKIGDLTLLQSHTLLVPKDQVVTIELRLDEDDEDEPLILSLRFEEDEVKDEKKEKPKSGIDITGEGKNANIKFLNWNKPFGSSLQKPISFAESVDGNEIFIMANARTSGAIYELIIQLLKGGGE